MAADRLKVKVGDLLEVQTSKGRAYIQYVGKHSFYGDAIRVIPGQYNDRAMGLSKAVAEPAGYLAFYPARIAVGQGLAEKVGSNRVPVDFEVPVNLRRAGARARTGEVLTWVIERDGQEIVKRELTEEERRLPIAAVWNHELLQSRITEGWSPEKEGGAIAPACDAQAEVQTISIVNAQHYVYFPTEQVAKRVVDELRQRGLVVDDRRSADDPNWLVLVKSRSAPHESDVAALRALLEDIAEKNGGEYDGWEAEVAEK